MFDTLGDRLDDIFKKLRSRGRLTEKEIDEALREIRVALLEADVALPAVRAFLQHVKAEALGEDVHKDRPRRAGPDARWAARRAGHRPQAADGHHARRPPGLRQDLDRRQ